MYNIGEAVECVRTQYVEEFLQRMGLPLHDGPADQRCHEINDNDIGQVHACAMDRQIFFVVKSHGRSWSPPVEIPDCILKVELVRRVYKTQ